MEQESIIPLFIDDENLPQLPLVGDLLEKMFGSQKIRFTKVWLTIENLFSILAFIMTVYRYIHVGALKTLNSNTTLWTGR